MFQQTPEDVKQYVSMPSRDAYDNILAAQQNMKMDTLLRVSAAIGADTRLTTYGHCVIWARYYEYFGNILFSYNQCYVCVVCVCCHAIGKRLKSCSRTVSSSFFLAFH